MIVDIRLADELKDTWQHRIRRQVDFKLASKAHSIRVLTIEFEPADAAQDSRSYRCAMTAQLVDGTSEQVEMNGLPNMCIADSAARLSRTIGRKAKNKQARWRSSARV
ncbi:MAG: hypothetical protein AAF993_01815 [Pseudomonadota bacterium]